MTGLYNKGNKMTKEILRWKEIPSPIEGRKSFKLLIGNTCLGEIHPVIGWRVWIVRVNGEEFRQPSKKEAKKLILKKQRK